MGSDRQCEVHASGPGLLACSANAGDCVQAGDATDVFRHPLLKRHGAESGLQSTLSVLVGVEGRKTSRSR